VVDSIAAGFVLLARQPYIGRSRDEDLRPAIRTFPVGDYVIAYRVDVDDVLILWVLRGSRDIEALFRERSTSGTAIARAVQSCSRGLAVRTVCTRHNDSL
jgi:ParE-like toxin of type II ParDE toxin-antitoxin system